MATSAQEAGSGFDQILKNTEFENDQQLKAVKAEQERIQSCQFQLKEKQTQILQFQKAISDLDEHAKQLHKQFLINRDNCESLKRTAVVLADHEEALKGKLHTTQKEVESDRLEQNESLSKYEGVWETYRVQYKNTQRAVDMQHTEAQLNNLRQENATLELNINQTKEDILALKRKGEGISLVAFVLKMAELHVETARVKQKMTERQEVRQEMTTGNPLQATQLEQDIEVLREKIKAEEMKKQKEREKRESQNEVQDNAMDTEESTSVFQPAHTPQRPQTPSLPTVLPVPVSTSKQSTPLSTPSRYQLEIPKLSIPSRLPTIRASISYSPASFQSPVFKVPTNRPRSSFQIPTLAISTPPRPSIPLLHTPIQQRPRLLSFTPSITRSTPQVTLSAPNNIRPTLSTLATSQSSSVQAPIITALQAGSNQAAPMQTMSPSQATSTQDSVVEMDSQALQQEPDGFELSSTSQESTSFATLFTSDSGHECTDYDGGDFGQTGSNQESSVNDQLEFTGEDDNGLFYGVEGSLSGLGNQPDTSATGDMFAGLGSESPCDDGGGFNLFSQDGVSDVSKQTTGATDTDFCFLFGGDDTAASGGSSSFSFF